MLPVAIYSNKNCTWTCKEMFVRMALTDLKKIYLFGFGKKGYIRY